MGLSAEQQREIEAYLGEVSRVLLALTSPEKTDLTIAKLRERIHAALSNGYATREDASRVVLDRLGDPIRLGVRLARTWGSEETGPQPPELPAIIQGKPSVDGSVSGPDQGSDSAGSAEASRVKGPVADGRTADTQESSVAGEDNGEGRVAEQPRREAAPVWLGICAWLRNEYGVPVWVTRPLFTLAGLIGWPVVLPLYMVGYWILRFRKKKIQPAALRPVRLILDPLMVGGLSGLLYAAGRGTLYGMGWASSRYLDPAILSRLGAWNWLETWQHTMLLMTLAYALPPAVLGAMPVPAGWSASLRRFALALVALYGLAVFAGVASLIAGSATQVAQILMGK